MVYCIMITVSIQSIVHTAFLSYLTYKLWSIPQYNTADIVPSAYAYPSAPNKEEYVL